MKKIYKTIAAILCIGAVCFLAGEWPETASRAHVLICDGGALAVALVAGLYLKRTEDAGGGQG